MITQEEVIAEESGVRLVAVEKQHSLLNVEIKTATFEIRYERGPVYRTVVEAGTEINHALALYSEVLKAAQIQPTLQLQEV